MGRTSDADERLMKAALELMWNQSYSSVSIDDICRKADVKKGSFYYFFESKAALAIAALERMWRDEWKPAFDERFSLSSEPLGRLTSYLEAVCSWQCECSKNSGKVLGCPVYSLGTEISTLEKEVGDKVRELMARKRRYLESSIRDAVADGSIETCDPAQKDLQLTCLVEGAVSQARIMNDPTLLESLPELGLDLLRPKNRRKAAAAAR